MDTLKKISQEVIQYSGKLIEVVQQEFEANGKRRIFEWARRGPGTRLIIDDEKKRSILIIKEYRRELNAIDFRLPGGKVYDRLEDYRNAKVAQKDMLEEAVLTVKREAQEETGIVPINPVLIKISNCGATVEWDLYYFSAQDFEISSSGQDLGFGENIEISWLSYDEVKNKCICGEISEDRTRGILLSYILNKYD